MNVNDPRFRELSQRIEELRTRLHALVRVTSVTNDELLSISRELDEVILRFQRTFGQGEGQSPNPPARTVVPGRTRMPQDGPEEERE